LKDFVLYCKSYKSDFLRLRRLLDSIEQFNADDLLFYISTPESDRDTLQNILGIDAQYIWISDEEIVAANPAASFEKYQSMPGGLSQAIVKSEFWRLKLAENYLCLDSDCVFIKPFHRSEFISLNGDPFTVLHQNKEYFQLANNRSQFKIESNLRAEAKRVQDLFERVGPIYFCAPAPFIWSAKVWESLESEYLQPKGMTLWDLVTPIEPLFRVYHYDWQYFILKRLGETEIKLKSNYLGVLYQSNWESALDYGDFQKSTLSRYLKSIKRFLRYLQSYL
jgi:hypothetical protein